MLIRHVVKLACLGFIANFWLTPAFAQEAAKTADRVIYTITAAELANHKLQVEAEFPASSFSDEGLTLALPVWTPGSYKVRDYSKSLSGVKLLHPSSARLEKTAKNRWSVVGEVEPGEPIKVAYTVYGHELTVRTNYFSPEFSLIAGAATFLAPAPLVGDRLEQVDFEVRFFGISDPICTGLTQLPSGENPRYLAHGYDELVDSPFLFGDLSIHTFEAAGKPHVLAHAGDYRYWNHTAVVRDAIKMIEAIRDFWGGELPYESYHILNVISDTRGGLEHLDSTVLMTSRFATEDRARYVDWLSLLSHEHFHVWNVKRLRPAALGPFNYESEVLTPSLWIAEGLTAYYDDLLVRRAGLSTRAEYLKALSGQLNTLQGTPGRKSIALTESSVDSWIRLYQPTDNTLNDNVSYYNKGAVVGWLLDTELRRRTNGKVTLDHVMREAYRRYAKDGFEEQQFRDLASELCGESLEAFFGLTLDSTEELPFDAAFDYWGLEWRPENAATAAEPYLGVVLGSGSLVVDSVAAGSPAAAAGIAPGDELLAIDGTRIGGSGPNAITKYLKLGRSYPVLVSRLGRVAECSVVLTAQPSPQRTLTITSGKGPHLRRLDDWLKADIPTPSKLKESAI